MTWSGSRLLAVKLLRTGVWAFFAGCILAIPTLASADRLVAATVLCAIVVVEVAVLAINGWRCPLTGLAARTTADRRDNFDIFLPEWLARHDKTIFGSLYAAGLVLVLYRWFR